MSYNKYLPKSLINTLFFTLFIFSTSCYSTSIKQPSTGLNSARKILHRDSFVKIDMKMTSTACMTIYKGTEKEKYVCIKKTAGGSGSGFIIKHTKKETIIITAAHVCNFSDEIKGMEPEVQHFNEQVEIISTDIDGTEHLSIIDDMDLDNDICSLKIKKINKPVVKISKIRPTPGDKVYNIAAPLGLFQKQSVPIFEGFYIGINKYLAAIYDSYSMPSYGGSSGSMILNHRGELIGILCARVIQVPIIVGPTYENLIKFIKKL